MARANSSPQVGTGGAGQGSGGATGGSNQTRSGTGGVHFALPNDGRTGSTGLELRDVQSNTSRPAK